MHPHHDASHGESVEPREPVEARELARERASVSRAKPREARRVQGSAPGDLLRGRLLHLLREPGGLLLGRGLRALPGLHLLRHAPLILRLLSGLPRAKVRVKGRQEPTVLLSPLMLAQEAADSSDEGQANRSSALSADAS